MKIYTDEKPDLEELAHHGVKGMKWGKRKKITSADIKEARIRQDTRANEINKHAQNLNVATMNGNKAGANKAAAGYAKAVKDFNTSDDRAVAARLTRGEKAATLILGGPVGAVVLVAHAGGVKLVEKSVQKQRANS